MSNVFSTGVLIGDTVYSRSNWNLEEKKETCEVFLKLTVYTVVLYYVSNHARVRGISFGWPTTETIICTAPEMIPISLRVDPEMIPINFGNGMLS